MSTENPTEEDLWWRGRPRPVLTRAEFDALSDSELTQFVARNVCRFYPMPQGDTAHIWWEGAEGWPTEFTMTAPTDAQKRSPFQPWNAEHRPTMRRLEGMTGVKFEHASAREFCWSVLRATGFIPGFKLAGELNWIAPKPKWPNA